MRAFAFSCWIAATLASCATPAHALDEGTGRSGRANMTTGIDAKDVTDLSEGVVATVVQVAYYGGCFITAAEDCAIRAENAGRRAIGRSPRDVDE